MQCRVDLHSLRQRIEQTLARIARAEHTGGRAHAPVRTGGKRLAPRGKPRFASVDLLPGADQRDDHRPVRMAPHDVEKQRGLALRMAELASPELGIPRTLCFVEYDDMLVRR